ncbi:glycosyltransferase family 4 protein [Streptomyces sp. NPDC050504]|uniref:glycosyltransferase family 4 protein n=1 Tax=Streptomyces sp. NPDC050504 TaxID=3365618 RepID=UPI0037919517
MKISFLIHTIYGIGGTIRTTLNLAEELAGRHEVEIVSVFRHRDVPLFAIDPRITVVPLIDTRPKSPTNESKHPEHLKPAAAFPAAEARYKEYSALTDERVRAHYADSDADVVIGTRPGLVAYVARFSPDSAVLIGQEHMTHNHHKPALRAELEPYLRRIDAFVTVSEGDAASWREHLPLPDTRVLAIPNSVPEPVVAPSDTSGTTVVAAGRLATEKQYHVLIDAFAKVVEQRPEWRLRICGWGPRKEHLRKKIDKMRLNNSVLLMGPRTPIDPEWVKGAIAVSTSRHESFGMTLVEAMRCGLPVVTTDCDYGPREIVQDGVDGLLVPVGDVDAVAAALLKLIDDPELRGAMGAAALRNARRFDPGPVTKQYEELFVELGAANTQRTAPHHEREAEEAGSGEPAGAAADCVVESDGALAFTLVSGAVPGSRLVVAQAAERSFDFDAEGRAVVPADTPFAEGVWRCELELPDGGGRLKLTGRSVDQRGALRAADRQGTDGARNAVPHVRDGVLMLRAWARPVHAEAGDIVITDRDFLFTGRIFGAAVGERPALVLRRRGDVREELEFEGRRVGADGFTVQLPAVRAVKSQLTELDVWEPWLRYAPDAAPVRVGRVLDDVVEKKHVFVYPPVFLFKDVPFALARAVVRKLRRQKQRKVSVKVFYSVTNDLVMHVGDVPVQ